MTAVRGFALAAMMAVACAPAFAQAEFRVYEEHPRLFLDPPRVDRLRRDVGRQTLRWQSLRQLADSGTAFPEAALVDALLYQAKRDIEAGLRAMQWSVGLASRGIRTAAQLREAALVYDWCHELYTSEDGERVVAALAGAVLAVLPQAGLEPGLVRSALLATIAAAGDWDGSEQALQTLLHMHWDREILPSLKQGGLMDDGATLVAILEASLAVRRNLEIDLLRPATDALAALVRTRLLSYHPLDVDTTEGRARKPSRFSANDEAAKIQAPLYRLADMLLVAYESNLREFQFVQGWIRDDNYQLKSAWFAPYEFLWVNPYLPGLTPQSAPLLAFDPVRGRLYGRQSWDRPTTWIGYVDGRMEILANGVLSSADSLKGLPPMFFPADIVVPASPQQKIVLRWEPAHQEPPEDARIFLVGLKPFETYGLRIGGREPRLVEAGAGGVIVLRSNPTTMKRDRIDLRKKVRLELKPTLKPTDPNRPAPRLRR